MARGKSRASLSEARDFKLLILLCKRGILEVKNEERSVSALGNANTTGNELK